MAWRPIPQQEGLVFDATLNLEQIQGGLVAPMTKANILKCASLFSEIDERGKAEINAR